MRIIRGVRLPVTITTQDNSRITGFEQVDLLVDGVVAYQEPRKISSFLRMPSATCLVQDANNGSGVFLMGFNAMADEIGALRDGSIVSYIGKAGTFRGGEKFTAKTALDVPITIVDNVISVPTTAPAEPVSDGADERQSFSEALANDEIPL